VVEEAVVDTTTGLDVDWKKVVVVASFLASEMAPLALMTKLGLCVVMTFLLCLKPTDFLPLLAALALAAAAKMLDLTLGLRPSGRT